MFFDFYNTLYVAHEWFELEIRELPSAVLAALREEGCGCSPAQELEAREAYRRVREGVHSSGAEVSATEGVRRAFSAAGVGVPQDLTGIIARLQRESYRPGREEPGAVECVRGLVADGYRLGIISNALWVDFLHWSLADSGMTGCFDGIFASAEVGYYKASPKLYEAAVRAMGAAPGEAVHVGDSYRFDVLGAKAAGLRAVWYSPASEQPPGDAADAVIKHLSELPAALASLSGEDGPRQ